MPTEKAMPRDDLFDKLPVVLQCYGVGLLWTLIALAQADHRQARLILSTLPPDSADALVKTGAMTPAHKLTAQGQELAKLAHEDQALIEVISLARSLGPLDAVLRVRQSLVVNPSDVICESS
jgi:hypothetical protein